jgi:hypothetical protein
MSNMRKPESLSLDQLAAASGGSNDRNPYTYDDNPNPGDPLPPHESDYDQFYDQADFHSGPVAPGYDLYTLDHQVVHYDNAREYLDAAEAQQHVVDTEYNIGGRPERAQFLADTLAHAGLANYNGNDESFDSRGLDDAANRTVFTGAGVLVEQVAGALFGPHAADRVENTLQRFDGHDDD